MSRKYKFHNKPPVILEMAYGKKFVKNTSIQKIRETLEYNKRGIIFGYNKNSENGHYFNVINDKGVIKFLDGQTGKSTNLKFDFYEFLPTN